MEDLITYCGLYGGVCARWCEYTIFRDFAGVFAEWVDVKGYQHWMPSEVKEFDYTEFREGLDFFSRKDTWLVCRKCCKGGDGRPDCEIRQCCKEHGLDVCFDCKEFPCSKIIEHMPTAIDRAKEYKRVGKDEWLQQEIEKAKKGYEDHTKKYYQIWANKCPPNWIQNKR